MTIRIWLMASCLSMTIANAQVYWQTDGNTGIDPTNDYVGTNENDPLNFRTDSIFRMRLHRTQSANINGYGTNAIKQNGFLGISDVPAFFTNSAGAFTRIHLVDSVNANSGNASTYAQQLGYRDWQRNGITMTGNSDQCYIGAKYNGNDSSDLVLQWSDNNESQPWGTDRLRFLFTTRRNGSFNYGAPSEEGLESFRIFIPNDTSALVGIGDWWKATVQNGGVPVDPTERLDILDGRLRIRELPTSPAASTLTQFLVTDANGVIHWRNVPTSPGGPGCEWTLLGGGNSNVATAYAGNPGCPQADRRVGIGTPNPNYKLDVVHNATNGGGLGGQRVEFTGLSTGWYRAIETVLKPQTGSSLEQAYGINVSVTGVDSAGVGVAGTVTAGALDGSTRDINGVSGVANGPSNGSNLKSAFGTRGEASCGLNGTVNASYGLYGKSHGANLGSSFGAYGLSYITSGTTQIAYGLYGQSNGLGAATVNTSIGVYGSSTFGTTRYGVYGVAANVNAGDTLNSSQRWAGYFQGKLKITGNAFVNGNVAIASDQNLKTNIEPIEGASAILGQLNPSSYEFVEMGRPDMELPRGRQFGLLAQELGEVLPELVMTSVQPAMFDSLGNELHPRMDLKMVNYIGLIPVLISGFKEQQDRLQEADEARLEAVEEVTALREELAHERERLDRIEQQLAACCANPEGVRSLPQGSQEPAGVGNDLTGTDKLRIQPNPFNAHTTVYYTLDRGGRTQLLANSSDGRDLRVLQEASLEAGSYQFEWDTTALAPGMYYVTLLVDGQPVVKKAVKVDR